MKTPMETLMKTSMKTSLTRSMKTPMKTSLKTSLNKIMEQDHLRRSSNKMDIQIFTICIIKYLVYGLRIIEQDH